MSIVPIDVGQEPNDETGDPLRDGGIKINANFAELDARTAAAQAKADRGVFDAAAAKAVADAAIPAAALGDSVPQLINGTVPASQLPSFVDDVLEFPTLADFPATGETGKIYIAVNDGDSPTNPTRQYRWSGSAFVLIPSSPGSTDQVPEGPTNQYFTAARVRSTTLSGLGALVNAAILATDTVLQAFAKLQGQLSAKLGKSEVATDSDKLGGQPASYYTTPMTGATVSADGVKGLVPAPPAGAAVRVLSSLGTWIAQATGGVWGGITGNLSDQADLKSALDGLAQRATNLEFGYVSADQTFSNGGTLTLNHGLGAYPATVSAVAKCTVAEFGYNVGTVLQLGVANNFFYSTSGPAFGYTIEVSATQLVVNIANGGVAILRKTDKITTSLTPANWVLTFKAAKS